MNETFGEILKDLRTSQGLSQQQLAAKLFVDRSSIANWETGRRTPDAALITRISQCLDVDVSYLMRIAQQGDEPYHVILVDDERIILSGSRPILEKLMPDATVTCFTKASEALAFARKNSVFLALLDIEIGKTSGLDLCRKLLEICPDASVIFLTAYMDYAFDAWDTGACGFLLKPLTESDVQKQLSKLHIPPP